MESLISMILKAFHRSLFTLALSLLSSGLMAGDSVTPLTEDGLEIIKKTRHGEVQLRRNTDWSIYTDIQLEMATIAFRKNWARDQKNRSGNRPTQESMGRIKSELSELLNDVFKQELTKDKAFTMSDTAGESVLLITPSVVDLDIVAPDRMRDHIGYSLTDSQGSMTLELDIRDSASGTLLARMKDNRMDPSKGYMEWTTAVTNQRAARLMLTRWAVELREWLIEAGQQA
jgi:hypothetical protein